MSNEIVTYVPAEVANYQPPELEGQMYLPGGPLKEEALSRATPDTQKKFLDLGGGKGYNYVEGKYAIDILNEAYGRGKWWHEVERTFMGPPNDKGEVEVTVALRLFVPGGPVRGIQGLGSDKYRPSNAVDNYANTFLSAETRALKRAARYLGIGLDVNDNPNEGAAIEASQETIMGLVKILIDRGDADRVKEIFAEHAEQVIDSTTGSIRHRLITEGQITPLRKALTAEIRAVKIA